MTKEKQDMFWIRKAPLRQRWYAEIHCRSVFGVCEATDSDFFVSLQTMRSALQSFVKANVVCMTCRLGRCGWRQEGKIIAVSLRPKAIASPSGLLRSKRVVLNSASQRSNERFGLELGR